MRTAVVSVAVGTFLLGLGTTSSAAPDRTLRLSRQSPSATWTSDIGVGPFVSAFPVAWDLVRCTEPAFQCDDTLLELSQGGDLEIKVVGGGPAAHPDLYTLGLRLFRSDASGTKRSEVRTESLNNRQRARALPPGFYVTEVSWMEGVGNYTGTATLRSGATSRRA